jgi:hypothetical protein
MATGGSNRLHQREHGPHQQECVSTRKVGLLQLNSVLTIWKTRPSQTVMTPFQSYAPPQLYTTTSEIVTPQYMRSRPLQDISAYFNRELDSHKQIRLNH